VSTYASEPDLPVNAEAKLEAYRDAMDEARNALRQARDAELEAQQARDAARRRAQLSAECPKVGVFDGVRTTVAYQQAWIEQQIEDKERAYQVAKLTRQAASDYLRTVGKQGSFQQSLTSSVRDSYRTAGSYQGNGNGRPPW
jgi:hypothetical protein